MSDMASLRICGVTWTWARASDGTVAVAVTSAAARMRASGVELMTLDMMVLLILGAGIREPAASSPGANRPGDGLAFALAGNRPGAAIGVPCRPGAGRVSCAAAVGAASRSLEARGAARSAGRGRTGPGVGVRDRRKRQRAYDGRGEEEFFHGHSLL